MVQLLVIILADYIVISLFKASSTELIATIFLFRLKEPSSVLETFKATGEDEGRLIDKSARKGQLVNPFEKVNHPGLKVHDIKECPGN